VVLLRLRKNRRRGWGDVGLKDTIIVATEFDRSHCRYSAEAIVVESEVEGDKGLSES
jgi:hypothetical protein